MNQGDPKSHRAEHQAPEARVVEPWTRLLATKTRAKPALNVCSSSPPPYLAGSSRVKGRNP